MFHRFCEHSFLFYCSQLGVLYWLAWNWGGYIFFYVYRIIQLKVKFYFGLCTFVSLLETAIEVTPR